MRKAFILATVLFVYSGFANCEEGIPVIPAPTLVAAAAEAPPVSLDLPSTFDASNFDWWRKLGLLLREGKLKSIILRDRGTGGDFDTVMDVVRSIDDAQASGTSVIIDVIGPAASGHAYMTCTANKVILRDGASLLFHHSYGLASFAWDKIIVRILSADIPTTTQEDYLLNECKKRGRLNDSDIAAIKAGDDVIIARVGNKQTRYHVSDNGSLANMTLITLVKVFIDLVAVGMCLYMAIRISKETWKHH